MLSSKLPFPTGWYGTEIPGYRICHETYERYPVDFLPPIPEELLDGTFSWLV
jgi:hypothetical protein